MKVLFVITAVTVNTLVSSVFSVDAQAATFEITGVIHRRVKTFQIGNRKFYDYQLCGEC